MSKDDDRAAFEKWCAKRYPLADATDADDRFEDALWECWQARGQQEPLTEARIDELALEADQATGDDIHFRVHACRHLARAILKETHG